MIRNFAIDKLKMYRRISLENATLYRMHMKRYRAGGADAAMGSIWLPKVLYAYFYIVKVNIVRLKIAKKTGFRTHSRYKTPGNEVIELVYSIKKTGLKHSYNTTSSRLKVLLPKVSLIEPF